MLLRNLALLPALALASEGLTPVLYCPLSTAENFDGARRRRTSLLLSVLHFCCCSMYTFALC